MGSNSEHVAAEPLNIGLRSLPYFGLLWMHFLTAASMAAFVWLSLQVAREWLLPSSDAAALLIAIAVFVSPSIVLAGLAGFIADQLEKRRGVWLAKCVEFSAAAILLVGVARQEPLVVFAGAAVAGAAKAIVDAVRFALVAHWFAPAKLVPANAGLWIGGWPGALAGIGLAAQVTAAGAFVTATIVLPLGVLLGANWLLSCIGILTFPKSGPIGGPKSKSWIPVVRTWKVTRELLRHASILRMAIGMVLFSAFATASLLVARQLAIESNGLSDEMQPWIVVYLSVGLILGCAITGLASLGRVELGLAPWGALLVLVGWFLLATSSADSLSEFGTGLLTLRTRTGLIFLAGGGATFCLPLVAYFQQYCAAEARGWRFAVTNLLAAAAIIFSAWVVTRIQTKVEPGSLANLPAALQLNQLTTHDQTIVVKALNAQPVAIAKDATKSFEAKLEELDQAIASLFQPPVPSDSTAASPRRWDVGRLPRGVKLAGLARLLWVHLQARQAAGDALSESDYATRLGDRDASLVAKLVLSQVRGLPKIAARQFFLLLGLLALPIFLYAVWLVPQAMARLPLWWAFRCLYRVRVNGLENIPAHGGAVLVINHSTWIDGLIILLMSARRIRMIAWAGNFQRRVMTILARFAQVILITGGPKSIQKGLAEGRKALQRGELVGIFPEGGISRTGQVREFRPGLLKLLERLPVPIIPVYIDQAWGSIFSYSGGTSLKKFPRTFRHRVTINIGAPLWRPETVYQVRQAVLQEGVVAVNQRQPPFACPAQMFIRACRKRRFKSKIGDSIGEELTGGMLLTRSLILRGLLRQHVLAPNEKIVGVLIPPSTGGVVTNMALALDRRVAVHLNYTLSEKLINECIKIAEVKHVLTTRKVMEKFKFNLQADVFYLDDLKAKVTPTMKAAALFQAYAWPRALLEMRLGLRDVPPDELLTVIFTSGSTGVPKGVMLSQRNIASNVESIGQVICLKSQDTLIGVLPFFHSFGYTVCLWGAMALDVRGAYHFSPLEATQVGKLARTFKGTVLLGTPTFLRTYLRKCTRDDFATVNTVVAGAEKLPAELAVAFDHRFGVRPVEGYGTTELSPLVSVNVPPSRVEKNYQPDSKEGSVGRPIPNVAAKVVDVDDPTRELGPNQSGMLWIKGPNVMLGYMHRPELTKEAIVDGWYCTGDVAVIDDAGFITLTGRMSRFSKIGGEMIPHIQIEEVLTSLLNDPDSDVQKVAVTAVPDAKKGERLIVLYTQLNVPPGELCQRLRESGLPNLFVPSEDSFVKVDAIPILGSGKLDLKRMKEVALQATGQAGKG